jgi:hypothetical protein
MRLWMIVSVLVLAFVVVSCTKKEPEPAPVEAAEVEAAATQAPAEAEAAVAEPVANPWDSWGEPGVTVLAPGKAPLRKLRRTFKKGRKATIDLQVKGGADVKTMSLAYALSLKTIGVSEDGTKATVELRVDEPAALKGVRGQYTVDALGVIADLEIPPPSGADPQTRQAATSLARFLLPVLAVPVPEDEVGEGAQWSVHETIHDGPVGIATRSIYELTKLDGSTVRVSMTFEEAVKKSDPSSPMKLLALQGAGSGTASFDLGELAPSAAKRNASRKQKFEQPNSSQVFAMSLQFATALSSR